MGEITDAARRLDQRKVAAMGGERMGRPALTEGNEAIFLLSGLDLDLDEVGQFCAKAREITFQCATSGAAVVDVAAALWVEGLAMGMLIAESRGAQP